MRWIDRVKQRMRRRGTVGAFRRQAEREGLSTEAFARKVTRNPKRYTKRTVARARLALRFQQYRERRK